MAKLKTDYKDWKPNQNGLQYKLGTTSLGNTSIADVTTYSQTGDEWSGTIINMTNKEVNDLMDRTSSNESQIAGIDKTLTKKIDEVDSRLSNRVEAVSTSLSDQIRQTNEKIDKLRYMDGELYPLQGILYKLYDLHRRNPITAAEYQALNLTAAEYRDYQISAKEYAFNAKTILER